MFPESYRNPFRNSSRSSRNRNPFSSSYYGRRRQQEDYLRRVEEERRRKAAIELERDSIRRQQIDEDRRRKAEYERRRQLEEEEIANYQQQQRVQQYRRQEAINRLKMEDNRRKKAELEQEQRQAEGMLREDQQRRDMLQRRKQQQSVGRSTANPTSSAMRGHNGIQYRVSAPPNTYTRWHYNNDESSTCSETGSSMSEEETYDVNMNKDTKDEFTYTPDSSCNSSLQYTGRVWDDTKSLKPLIEVEDVPDDEDDELRDLHSVWRNRVPSKGEWMEPIESFGR